MKLIVGLGNPGEKYRQNRHNVGFLLVDFLVQKYYSNESHSEGHEIKFEQNAKFHAEILELQTPTGKILFAKPQTFMNRTGESVAKLKNFYKIHPEDIFIAHDDLDIPFGKSKIQHGTGPKVHNGITSIVESIGSEEFWRIRIGVDNRTSENRMPGEAYVLQDFTSQEQAEIKAVFEKISTNLSDFHFSV